MKEKAIGVYDSGLGGLAVARKVMDEMPEEDIVYFADFAHLPYGPRPREEVRGFVLQVVDFFIRKDVKAILIACNTASIAGGKEAQGKARNIPVIGMIEPAVKATLKHDNIQKVGVIGTIGTIKSKAYEETFRQLSPSVEVLGHACPELLRLTEQGKISDRGKIHSLAEDCVAPLEREDIDALILGCTDFTCIVAELRAVLSRDVQIVDPAEEVVKTADRILQGNHWRRTRKEKGHMSFFSSGKAPQGAKEFSRRIFDIQIEDFLII